MSIIARRIPSPLSGAESCGPTQKWDPNYVFSGIKGQCVPASQPLVQMASGSSGSSWGAGVAAALTSLWGPKPAAPMPAYPTYMPAPSQGMSQNTMIAVGLGALGLVAILIATRK